MLIVIMTSGGGIGSDFVTRKGTCTKAGHRVKDFKEKRRAESRQKHVLVTVSWWSYFFSFSVFNWKRKWLSKEIHERIHI